MMKVAAFSGLVAIISVLILPALIYKGVSNDQHNNTSTSVSKSSAKLNDQNHLEDLGSLSISLKCPLQTTSYHHRDQQHQDFGIVVFTDSTKRHQQDRVIQFESKNSQKDKHDDTFVSEEAEINLRKAMELASLGKRSLARKLFKHALSLDPNSIEALNNYGEFLENEEDLIQADLFYQRALSNNPRYTTAMINRERTAPLVKKQDALLFDEIDRRKRELYTYSAHHPTLRSYMKESYYHHIYHTVALEGNKLTREEMRVIIDHQVAVQGRSLHEHNEVIGMSDALQYINNTLINKIGSITVDDIKNLHKRVMGRTDPYVAGQFRSSQVFIGRHIPPHPSDVDEFMDNFEEWLNSPSLLQLHAVEFAALAHYRLVYIHPFLDGNGRTARLLMNLILMRSGIPPVSIQVEDRWIYYQTLTQANEGDVRPFVRFIASCTRQTLDDYLHVASRFPSNNQDHLRSSRLEDRQRHQQHLNSFT